jgi:hypothetical protein
MILPSNQRKWINHVLDNLPVSGCNQSVCSFPIVNFFLQQTNLKVKWLALRKKPVHLLPHGQQAIFNVSDFPKDLWNLYTLWKSFPTHHCQSHYKSDPGKYYAIYCSHDMLKVWSSFLASPCVDQSDFSLFLPIVFICLIRPSLYLLDSLLQEVCLVFCFSLGLSSCRIYFKSVCTAVVHSNGLIIRLPFIHRWYESFAFYYNQTWNTNKTPNNWILIECPPETKIFSYSTELSFEARDKLSKRKLVPRTQSYLLAHWILAERARARVEPRDLFWLFFPQLGQFLDFFKFFWV